ncbi:MAG TPA: hypothetical protein VGD79_04540 [Thermoanaerobaculia bacterium]|jgi:hypothetical protein
MRKVLLLAAFLLLATSAAYGQQCLLTTETETLAPFFVNTPGHFQIVAVSGTEPYTFSVYNNTLPDEFHLTQKGKLIGKPSVEMETVIFVTITDAAGCQLTQAYNLVVLPESGPPQ